MTVPPGEVDLLAEPHDSVDISNESGGGEGAIKGRSPWSIAWRRLRRDKAAMAGGDRRRPARPAGHLLPADREDLRPRPERHAQRRQQPHRPVDPAAQGLPGRHHRAAPARRRARQRPGPRRPGPHHRRLVGVAAGRLVRHAALGRHRRHHRRGRRLLRRLGRRRPQPHHGHRPGLPAAAVRHRDLGVAADPGEAAPHRQDHRHAAAHLGDRLRHRLLQLALHRPHHPRPDPVPARARVHRRLPQPGRPRALHRVQGTAART